MTPPGCRAITAILLLIANFKIIRRGRRPRRPVQPCVIAKLTVYRRGGFHIRPCNLAQSPNCQEGSRPIPTNQHKNHPPKKPQRRTIPRGVEDAAPYTQPYKGCRGEHCSPARVSRRSPPTHQKFWHSTTPLGFLGASAWRRTTSAASLLRKPARAVIRPAGANIARSPVSLRSTVAPCSQPRNPLGRGSLPRNSETFFASFFGHKKGRFSGSIPLKRESGRERKPHTKNKLPILHPPPKKVIIT